MNNFIFFPLVSYFSAVTDDFKWLHLDQAKHISMLSMFSQSLRSVVVNIFGTYNCLPQLGSPCKVFRSNDDPASLSSCEIHFATAHYKDLYSHSSVRK